MKKKPKISTRRNGPRDKGIMIRFYFSHHDWTQLLKWKPEYAIRKYIERGATEEIQHQYALWRARGW